MNIPNKLTVLRVLLVPFFMVALLLPESTTVACWLAAIVFSLTAITDFLDGKIARKYNMVTTFGKFLDPAADKFMIISALFGIALKFPELRMGMAWICLIVVFRELMVTSLRLVVKTEVVVPANFFGKMKTVSQCVAVLVALLETIIFPGYRIMTWICMIIMALLTIYSGTVYFLLYKKHLNFS